MQLPRSISSSIDQIARTAIGKDWGLYATLIENWAEIVGPDYAKDTSPVKIVFPQGKKAPEKWANGHRTNGTLTISLPHGLSMEFSHSSEQIRSRINSYFGYEAIGRITLKPYYPSDKGPISDEPKPLSADQCRLLEDTVNNIENNELREALQQLGTSVLANQKRV